MFILCRKKPSQGQGVFEVTLFTANTVKPGLGVHVMPVVKMWSGPHAPHFAPFPICLTLLASLFVKIL